MDLATALRERRSIRTYRPAPVSDELVRELLDEAHWAPSWANTQSWSIWVVRGAALERIRAAMRERLEAPAAPDLAMPGMAWPDELKARTAQLRATMAAQAELPGPSGSAEFFGAPCLVVVGIDARVPPEYECFDAGLFVQSLCLAAHNKGLGTCIMAMAVRHPAVLRGHLLNTAGKRFVVGIALGYPEPEAPLNRFARERAPLDELVTWVA